MVRVYRRYRQQRDRDEDRWIANLIAEAQAGQAQNPMSVEEMLAEDDRLARYRAQPARKAGIQPTDVARVIQDYRKARKA